MARDPYPLYHAIRSLEPVYRDPQLKRWLVTGYEQGTMVMSDARFSSKMAVLSFRGDQSAAPSPVAKYLSSTMVMNDPPNHTRLRNLVGRAFTPRVLEGLRDRIQQLTDALLDAVQPAGQMEVMRELAYPLPLRVIGELLGVEHAMADRLKQWSNGIIRYIGTPNATPEIIEAANRSVIERNAYILGVADQRGRSRATILCRCWSPPSRMATASPASICCTTRPSC